MHVFSLLCYFVDAVNCIGSKCNRQSDSELLGY